MHDGGGREAVEVKGVPKAVLYHETKLLDLSLGQLFEALDGIQLKIELVSDGRGVQWRAGERRAVFGLIIAKSIRVLAPV
jgi:hypothetical protein